MAPASTESKAPNTNEPSSPTTIDPLLLAAQPPSVFIFNAGRTPARQINDGPWQDETLLQSFINGLQSIQEKGYRIQGAMYSPEGVNIFINTDDQNWDDEVFIR
ncbi:hypothetical protein NLJ89_g8813 [Agrocybe chaxingu]|uniref:Uncharacterized protein n=1 Tax=Agrocybe chaxingu TaxID=84603 RepID=A0A9W8MRT8_9AGAR|nr:hypothetical protein NLJ89_g8813 [Agrocybe chaxingu]